MSRSDALWQRIVAGKSPDAGEIHDLYATSAVRLGERGARRRAEEVTAEVLGAGPVQSLLEQPGVTDVLINGAESVWVDRGDGPRAHDLRLSEAEVRRLAVRLAALAGRRLDEASPYVDAVLPGGVRLHAVLPPLVHGGVHLSLRVPRQETSTLADLAALGTMDGAGLAVLRQVVAHRAAFVISGGTGCGKSTLLAAMLAEADPDERLLVVEDVSELSVAHPHVVRMQARAANVEGIGEVSLADLVRQSLRMRPDRVVVGEVRGAEVRELMSALNTGHEGGCGTVHANASADVVARFEALGALAGMTPEAVHAQLGSAIQVVVHMVRVPQGRRVAEIGYLTRGEDGQVRVDVAWRRQGEALVFEGGGAGGTTREVPRCLRLQ